MKTTQTVKTYLTVFPGFYGTHFEVNGDELENLESDYVETELFINPTKIYFDDHFDFKAYQQGVCKYVCQGIEKLMSDFVISVKFENLYSPREYNFTNDSINCEIEVNIDAVKKYIYNNRLKYEIYLEENFKSRSGFHSFYAHDFDSWKTYTNDFTDYSENGLYLGSVLNFIAENEEIDSFVLYKNVSEFINVSEYMNYKFDMPYQYDDVKAEDILWEIQKWARENYKNEQVFEDAIIKFEKEIEYGFMVDKIIQSEFTKIDNKTLSLF